MATATATASASPTPLPYIYPINAREHLNQRVTLKGRVLSVVRTKKGNVFLNYGKDVHKQNCVVIIYPNEAGKFPKIEEVQGKEIEVTGMIRDHEGMPQIQLVDPSQIK